VPEIGQIKEYTLF